jgi:D-alanyl-lipoteichoic acid acyltransferase DltB (MBOAT superfamily)
VAKGKFFPSLKEVVQMGLTFLLVVFAWIFFRANNLGHAMSYISGIFSPSLFSVPYIIENETGVHILPKILMIIILLFLIIEWIGREQQYAISCIGIKWYRPLRWAMYYGIISIVYYYLIYSIKEQSFIYFQF